MGESEEFMNESKVVRKYKELYGRAGAVGLTLKTNIGQFEFNIPEARGIISMETLEEVELFLRGFEICYKMQL